MTGTWDSAIDLLERAVTRLRPARAIALRLAVAAATGGTLIWLAVDRAVGAGSGVALTVAAVLLLLPPATLALFALALRALAAAPRRLRDAPAEIRERADKVKRQAGEVTSREAGPIRSLLSALRIWWTVAASREVLEIVGPAAILLNPGALVATGVAAVAAVLEVVAGIGALLWLAVA